MMYAYASRLHAVTDDSLEAWISILKQVPNAVLLLPDHPPVSFVFFGLASMQLQLVIFVGKGLFEYAYV